MRVVTILIFLITAFPVELFANDGLAQLGVGGVTISKTANIAIEKEVLDISTNIIKVQYDFINVSDQNEYALLMFPLPPYPATPSEGYIIAHGQPAGFTILVDGKPVNYDTEVKAILNGNDVTNILKSIGYSSKQIAEMPFDETLEKDHELQVSKSKFDKLIENNLVKDGSPLWEIHVTYVWRQIFTAKSIVHVEHTYRPFIAERSLSGFSPNYFDTSRFCFTDEQKTLLENIYKEENNRDTFAQIPGSIVEYILTTSNSWKDGIRDFELRIHSKSKDEIVALCFPAKLHKISETLHTTKIKNFRPKADLLVYFGNTGHFNINSYGEPPKFK